MSVRSHGSLFSTLHCGDQKRTQQWAKSRLICWPSKRPTGWHFLCATIVVKDDDDDDFDNDDDNSSWSVSGLSIYIALSNAHCNTSKLLLWHLFFYRVGIRLRSHSLQMADLSKPRSVRFRGPSFQPISNYSVFFLTKGTTLAVWASLSLAGIEVL